MSPRFGHLALQRLARLFDMAVVCISFMIALAAASGSFSWSALVEVLSMRVQLSNLLFIGLYLGICSVTFTGCGFYLSHRLSHWPRRIREIFIAVTLITGLLFILRRPFNFSFASNGFLIIYWFLTFSIIALARIIGHRLLYFVRTLGRNLRSIVVVGEGLEAAALGDRIEQDPSLGYRLIRIIDVELFKAPEIAIIDQLNAIMALQPVDEVLLALPMNKYGNLTETLIHYCEEQGTIVRVRPETFKLQYAKSFFDDLQGVPVMTIQSGPTDSWQLAMKRFIDLLGSAALLLVLAPFFAVIAALIRLDSPGPVFFSQERVGFNKRRFKMLKFRTMVDEADKQQEMLEHLNEADGPVFKIKNDPRITRIGAFLRRFSIDELPQFINVFKGDMSLVGPRPLPLRDVDRIEIRWHKRRFSIKPGITCLWQVNGRSEIGFDDWVRMDLEYIDKWSLILDMIILIKTIPAVFKGPGAY